MRHIATAALGATLALFAGCGPSEVDTVEPLPAAPTQFGKQGVAVKQPADVLKLKGAPEDFQQFVAGRLDEARATQDPEFPECTPTVVVDVYDPKGFASGARTDCGGYAIIWAKKDGVWQEVWGGQDLAECADLTAKQIPPSVVHDQQCYDKKAQKALRYRG